RALFGFHSESDNRLARVDADANLKSEAGGLLVQLGDSLQNPQAGTNGALGVVLVSNRRSEDGHDRVAYELLDCPLIKLDLTAKTGVIGTEARAHVLGVTSVGRRREADQVAEEDADDLPFLERGRSGSFGERRRAKAAELEAVRVLVAAGGA